MSEHGMGATLAGTVEVVEHLGNEQVVYVRVPEMLPVSGAGEPTLTARVDAGVRVGPGDGLALSVDPTHVYLFDAKTGAALVQR